jgi:Fic family protein
MYPLIIIMAYHEQKKIGKNKFHYVVKAVRIGNRIKKLRIYAGKGEKSKKEIEALLRKYSPQLEKRSKELLSSLDPLLGLVTESEEETLRRIRGNNREKLGKMDKLAWKNYYEWFLAQFTYNTNAIEGSTLTLEDTSLILFENVVPRGKSPREINEVQNHKEAFDFTLSYKENLTRKFVLEVHKRLMHNILWKAAGRFRDVNVYIRGVDMLPPPHSRVEEEFKKLVLWHAKSRKKYNPVVATAYFHCVFESIHPFRDGNGRTGRLILNFMLRKEGFPMIDIKNREKQRYYSAIYEFQKNRNLRPFVEMVIDYLKDVDRTP